MKCIVALVAGGTDIDAREENGVTPLCYAAFKGHVSSMLTLIQRGADVNVDSFPMLGALANGSTAAVEALVQAGANVNAVTSSGNTALHFAAQKNRVECIVALIAAGADIDARDRDGFTPLLAAIVYGQGHEASILTLIQHGADVNLASFSGMTPLSVALGLEVGEACVVALIEAGADVIKAEVEDVLESRSQSSTSTSSGSPSGPSRSANWNDSSHVGLRFCFLQVEIVRSPPTASLTCGSLEPLPISFVSITRRSRPAWRITFKTL